MFKVRSTRALTPSLQSFAAATPHHPRYRYTYFESKDKPYQGSGLGTTAFNQPLSLDTSSVTDMRWMFWVRFARVP